LNRVLAAAPRKVRERASLTIERESLRGLLRFYRAARFVLAPNQSMVDLLHARTGKPAFLMRHGVDLAKYSAAPSGSHTGRPFCIGYVGRLTTEKNVRFFMELESTLLSAGQQNFAFLIVGEGGQQKWMQRHLQNAEFAGVLRGTDLAAAYGRMDAFVFPSLTDTFGLVVLEAMASGIPVIVAPETGQRVGIEDGVSGFLSRDFGESLLRLMRNPSLLTSMSGAARKFACEHSWQSVFEQLYETYADGLSADARMRALRETA
jgi:glycosyltransferase involved in cell wall biosynthesis